MAAVKPTQNVIGETRRLPSLESALLRPTQHAIFGLSRDIGMVRSNNEDSVLAYFLSQLNILDRPDLGVFVVADGAGGHQNGEQASAIASRMVADAVNAQIFQPMLAAADEGDMPPDLPPIAEIMTEALKAADALIQQRVPDGGTTLTAAALIGDLVHIAHVGDSRAYALIPGANDEESRLEQLTRDHSVAKRLEEIGQITREEADHHPEASRLWKILGLTDNLEPDIITRRLPPGSRLMLCSDGLWNMVPEEEIIAVLSTSALPQEAADLLIAAANAHGGADNIGVIVVHMPPPVNV
jgi:protein phosphatase